MPSTVINGMWYTSMWLMPRLTICVLSLEDTSVTLEVSAIVNPGNRDIKQVPVLCYDTKNTWGRQECENMRPFCFGCMFLELLIDALCIVLGLFGHVSL